MRLNRGKTLKSRREAQVGGVPEAGARSGDGTLLPRVGRAAGALGSGAERSGAGMAGGAGKRSSAGDSRGEEHLRGEHTCGGRGGREGEEGGMEGEPQPGGEHR